MIVQEYECDLCGSRYSDSDDIYGVGFSIGHPTSDSHGKPIIALCQPSVKNKHICKNCVYCISVTKGGSIGKPKEANCIYGNPDCPTCPTKKEGS